MQDGFDSTTYREIQNDGLLDLFLGSLIVVFFLFEVSEVVGGVMTYVPAALLFLLIGGLVLVRRRYTYPRVGTPSNAVPRRIIAGIGIALGAAVALGLLVLVSEVAEGREEVWTGAALMTGALVAFGSAAMALKVPRLWVYALIFGGPWLIWGLLDTAGIYGNPGPFLILGVLSAFAMGVVHLARFSREHPRPPVAHA